MIDGAIVTMEIRSVNHRYLEFFFRIPKELSYLEEPFRQRLSQKIRRGRIDLTLTIEAEGAAPGEGPLPGETFDRIYRGLTALKEKYGLDEPITIQHFLINPLLFTPTPASLLKNEDAMMQMLLEALQGLEEMRRKEGEDTGRELRERISLVERIRTEIAAHTPLVVEEYRRRLKARMEELLKELTAVDEDRLMLEVAVFAERSDISEELSRLRSHEEQFISTLDSSEAIGRKLDFILQEMNREINTIGSKANDARITRNVIELKSEIEKMREQVQNIE